MVRRTHENEGGPRWEISSQLRRRMVEVARGLREKSTKSEQKMWAALRGRRLQGQKFRRQQPVGPFVIDFYCAQERLAVEIDGGVHESPEQAILDRERQALLESLGIRFVRVADGLVLQDLPAALTTIATAFTAHASNSAPSPLVGEGRGEGSPASADARPTPTDNGVDR